MYREKPKLHRPDFHLPCFLPYTSYMRIEQVPTVDAVRDAFISRMSPNIEAGTPILFLASGGSTAGIAVSVCKRLEQSFRTRRKTLRRLLTVTLADERFGPVGHADSNWRYLLENGLQPESFNAFPVLVSGDHGSLDPEESARRFDAFLSESVLRRATEGLYIAGIFGLGTDGHTAGILPESPASRVPADSNVLAIEYSSPLHHRITVTPAFFAHIDFAAVGVLDQTKRQALENLSIEQDIVEQPVRAIDLARESIIYTVFDMGRT